MVACVLLSQYTASKKEDVSLQITFIKDNAFIVKCNN